MATGENTNDKLIRDYGFDAGTITANMLGIRPEDLLIAREYHPSKEVTNPLYEILVICNENQGRSQMVALEMLAFMSWISFDMPVKITSVGVNATPEKYSGRPNPEVLEFMSDRSISKDRDEAYVKQLQPEHVKSNTIALVLGDIDKVPDYIFKSLVVLHSPIKDPSTPEGPLPKDTNVLDEIWEETHHIALSVIYKLAKAIYSDDFDLFLKFFRKIIISHKPGSSV